MKPIYRMYGRIIELCKFQVEYKDELTKEIIIEYVCTKEEADFLVKQKQGVASELNITGYNWIDGIEVKDVPNTQEEAEKIINMGFERYLEEYNLDANEKILKEILEIKKLLQQNKFQ